MEETFGPADLLIALGIAVVLADKAIMAIIDVLWKLLCAVFPPLAET